MTTTTSMMMSCWTIFRLCDVRVVDVSATLIGDDSTLSNEKEANASVHSIGVKLE